MHTPISALLVVALLTGEANHGHVRLPPPFDHATIDLRTFAPGRVFDRSRKETLVL